MIEGFDTLNQILKPFLNCVRIPKFKSREDGKYNDYPVEENMEIYLSSAWYSSSWAYDLYRTHVKRMLQGKDYFVCNLPYQLSVHHKLLTEKRVSDMKSDENMTEVSFKMEFEVTYSLLYS